MSLLERLPFVRKLPPPPPQEAQTIMDTLRERVAELPYVRPAQAFWANLRAVESLWPLLLPLLAWVGWRSYWAERRRIAERAAADQRSEHS